VSETAIRDVTSADFSAAVLEASRHTPVVVDFWAPWCGPCRALTPMLDKLAKEYAGRIVFTKLNADENQDIAGPLGVRSIPNVKAFVDGKIASEFTGVIPESAIRAFLDKLVPGTGEKLRREAVQAAASGRNEAAEKLLQAALAAEPGLDAARIDLAELLLTRDAFEEAGKLLDALPEEARDERGLRALDRIDNWRKGQSLPAAHSLQAAVAARPDDLALRLQLGERHAADGQFEQALEQFLTVVTRDRSALRESARQAMLKTFSLAAGDADLVGRYRRSLASALN
jgi:putative thioredoxin